MTELGDAEVTELQVVALSRFTAPTPRQQVGNGIGVKGEQG